MGIQFRKALEKRYEAQIAEAKATANVYLEKPVAIGEHPQFIDELDKLVQKIATAEENLKVLRDHFDDTIPF
tara:strand:- start:2509 stop:2724 length:216 start_codon:yes stop_codon:yes gene_type:complete